HDALPISLDLIRLQTSQQGIAVPGVRQAVESPDLSKQRDHPAGYRTVLSPLAEIRKRNKRTPLLTSLQNHVDRSPTDPLDRPDPVTDHPVLDGEITLRHVDVLGQHLDSPALRVPHILRNLLLLVLGHRPSVKLRRIVVLKI